jgi:hypothetical protein
MSARTKADRKRDRKARALALPADPLDWQERHSPTEAVRIILPRSRTPQTVRMRSGYAALWKGWTQDQRRAFLRIGAAFAVIGRGLGVPSKTLPMESDLRWYDSAPSTATHGERSDYEAELVARYFEWGRECTRSRINHSAIMDVIGYDLSCRQVDRRRHQRDGTTAAHIAEGLALYIRLGGAKFRSAA